MEELVFNVAEYAGPLDLILKLLSRNKFTIADMNLSAIVDQFTEQVRGAPDLDAASEFSVMAAHLVRLKSRMLLELERKEAEAELAELRRSLEERQGKEIYARLKPVFPFFIDNAKFGAMYAKPPETQPKRRAYSLTHSPYELSAALRELKIRPKPVKRDVEAGDFYGIVGHEPFPVELMVERLTDRLSRAGRLRISAIYGAVSSRSELIASFLALLELCRLGTIRADFEPDGETAVIFN